MAVYPVLPQSYDSRREPIDSTKMFISGNGTVRSHVKHSKTVYQFAVLHPFLTATQKDSVQSFYDTYKNESFTFNYAKDGVNYTLNFTGEPEPHKINAKHWHVTLNAYGVKV